MAFDYLLRHPNFQRESDRALGSKDDFNFRLQLVFITSAIIF